jgi:hypothetical protein
MDVLEEKNLLPLHGIKPRISSQWPSRHTYKLLQLLTYLQVTIFRRQQRLYEKEQAVFIFEH